MNDKTNEYALDYILANYFDGDDSPRYCVEGDDEHMVMKKAAEALEEVITKKTAKIVINDIETWKTPAYAFCYNKGSDDYYEGCDDYNEGWNDAFDLAIQFIKQRFNIKENNNG